ncbi:hypothetical protein [Nannocystis punicea]|uniref:Cell division protein FtsL n=1 Tax=Nannocystis punicea TaxID=2995304 RepID=A0ABY7H4V3_9BACT|nr:hypothetical protein [Nannocystis poenicansa]WAS94313.1 hypothetical protein O0S08_49965 [Nannocystis poenicansa]
MSIYGPPTPPVRDNARRASAHGTRVFLALIVLGVLTSVGVIGLLECQKHSSERLEVQRAETIRLDTEALLEAERLQTAELLPAIPSPPNLEIPPSVISQPSEPAGDLPVDTGRIQTAEPLQLKPGRKSAPAEPAEPERLQTAEILR